MKKQSTSIALTALLFSGVVSATLPSSQMHHAAAAMVESVVSGTPSATPISTQTPVSPTATAVKTATLTPTATSTPGLPTASPTLTPVLTPTVTPTVDCSVPATPAITTTPALLSVSPSSGYASDQLAYYITPTLGTSWSGFYVEWDRGAGGTLFDGGGNPSDLNGYPFAPPYFDNAPGWHTVDVYQGVTTGGDMLPGPLAASALYLIRPAGCSATIPTVTPTAVVSPTATATATSTSTPMPPTATPTHTPNPTATTTPASPAGTLGYTGIGGYVDTGDSSYLNGERVTTGAYTETVSSISGYVGAVDASPHNRYSFAIYADSAGVPSTLLAHSAIGTLKANSWNTLKLHVVLKPHTVYYLQYATNGRTYTVNNLYYNDATTALGVYTAGSLSSGWPTTYGAAYSYAVQYSLYASVTP